MDSLGIDGVVTGLVSFGTSKRVAGRARTIKIVPTSPDVQAGVHLGATTLSTAHPDDIVVVANDARVGMAAWGGLLSLAAIRRGISGVVVDGAVRDVDEARDY